MVRRALVGVSVKTMLHRRGNWSLEQIAEEAQKRLPPDKTVKPTWLNKLLYKGEEASEELARAINQVLQPCTFCGAAMTDPPPRKNKKKK